LFPRRERFRPPPRLSSTSSSPSGAASNDDSTNGSEATESEEEEKEKEEEETDDSTDEVEKEKENAAEDMGRESSEFSAVFFSGSKSAVAHWIGHPNFEIVRHDITEPFLIEVDQIYHLACPASPGAYQFNAVKTMKTNFMGTMNMLGLAKRVKARFLLASTSEIYGSPEVHPQVESYWGNVNCVGPRACYDEGKRVAEALTYGYHRQDGVDVRVARIFNTFGPRMSPDDGRVVSNFVMQALRGEDLTVYGDGLQTRSLCYVHDLIDALILLMNSDCNEPVNLGNQEELTIAEWASVIIDVVAEVCQAYSKTSTGTPQYH